MDKIPPPVAFVGRLAVLALVVSGVIVASWGTLHRPYLLEKTRATDMLLEDCKAAVARAERAIERGVDEYKRLNDQLARARSALKNQCEATTSIQERIDAIDSRLYRIERAPGLGLEEHSRKD